MVVVESLPLRIDLALAYGRVFVWLFEELLLFCLGEDAPIVKKWA